jgi:branched-chain amino acid transport system substrate-binding protein
VRAAVAVALALACAVPTAAVGAPPAVPADSPGEARDAIRPEPDTPGAVDADESAQGPSLPALPYRILRETPPAAPEDAGTRAPEGLTEIRIGWFGPDDPDDPDGGDLWRAASMAVDEANAEGGYRGLPFRLVPAWSDVPWGTGVARLVRLVYEEEVRAVLGSVDGATTHLAEQVVAKARVPLVNPAATDATLHLAGVPWMFSCPPGDQRIVPVLADGLHHRGARRWVLASALDHDSRALAGALLSHLGPRGMTPVRHVSTADHPVAEATSILDAAPDAVVVVAGPRPAAALVTALRAAGFTGPVLGGPGLARRAFADLAGAAAEGTLVPLLVDPEPFDRFDAAFRGRFGRPADAAAGHAYDAATVLIAAIRRAGPDPAAIREALAGMPPAAGVTGLIDWDPVGQNRRPVRLGMIQGGRILPGAREAETVPRSVVQRTPR